MKDHLSLKTNVDKDLALNTIFPSREIPLIWQFCSLSSVPDSNAGPNFCDPWEVGLLMSNTFIERLLLIQWEETEVRVGCFSLHLQSKLAISLGSDGQGGNSLKVSRDLKGIAQWWNIYLPFTQKALGVGSTHRRAIFPLAEVGKLLYLKSISISLQSF